MPNNFAFRPSGSAEWFFSRLPNCGDFTFVGCAGTEERTTTAFAELRRLSLIRDCSIVEINDVPSDYSAEIQRRRERAIAEFKALGANDLDFRSVDLLAKEEDIIQWVQSFLTTNSRLVLDISTLPKRFFFPAIRLLLKQATISDLIVTYTSPMYYPDSNLAERPSDWRALPLFGLEEFPDPKFDLAIIGVGFLPFGLPELFKSGFLNATPHLLFPFPASPAASTKAWNFVRQIEASVPLSAPDQLVRVNGMDPSVTFDHVCWLTDTHQKKVLFAPYGPKPMSLGMAVYASLTDSPVFYTQPRVYRPDYTSGVRVRNSLPDVTAFALRLNGKNFYTL